MGMKLRQSQASSARKNEFSSPDPLPVDAEASSSLVTKLFSREQSLFLLRRVQLPAKEALTVIQGQFRRARGKGSNFDKE